MPSLWVYGASNCTPWGLDREESCWTEILGRDLGLDLKSRAEIGCDNTFIYDRFISDLDRHGPDDQIIMAWSHPNRKCFVLDQHNPEHLRQIEKGAQVYHGDPAWFRSQVRTGSGVSRWLNMAPRTRGDVFFDTWFRDYHSEHEQRLNFGAYHDSVTIKAACSIYTMYFSRESVLGLSIRDDALCYLEFVLENRVALDQNDLHCNAQGHRLLAQKILGVLLGQHTI